VDKAKIYVGEIKIQIEFAKKAYNSYLEAKKKEEVSIIFYHLHHFLIHTSNIDKILSFDSRRERFEILNKCIDLKGVNIKPFRKLRNNLEHFDERLDSWIINHYNNGYAFFRYEYSH
jgi:CRISPR/Cas system-associated endonuclease Cas3-HD